jgi:hypothetical protein
MTENKKIYIAIAGVVVILAVIIPIMMGQYNGAPAVNYQADTNSKMVTGSDTETFSGTLSAVDTGCFADAVCSVTVDGKKVILVKGGRGLPPDTVVGRLIGVENIGDLQTRIGAFVNVFAGRTPEGDFTLYGNSDYYVEVVMISGK